MKEIKKLYYTSRRYVLSAVAGLCITVSLCLSVTPVYADHGFPLFNSKCGKCHYKGGSAGLVNPADKAARVWGRYFKRIGQRHPVTLEDQITVAEMQEIQLYLMKHAADSEFPFAAAIPQ